MKKVDEKFGDSEKMLYLCNVIKKQTLNQNEMKYSVAIYSQGTYSDILMDFDNEKDAQEYIGHLREQDITEKGELTDDYVIIEF